MSGVRVQDRRRVPFFMVGKPDLTRLADACEPRSLPYARSLYFALLELANDQRCDEVAASRMELAARAGVSPETVKRLAPVLAEAGLIEMREIPGYPNVWTLLGGEVGSEGPGGVGSDRPGGRVAQARGSGLTDPGLKETVQEGKNGRSKNPSGSRQLGGVEQVWGHYQETMPNGSRCQLTSVRRQLIERALKLRTVDECKEAITSLSRSEHHVAGGYLDIRYALRGGGHSPDPEATIDRLVAQLRNGHHRNGRAEARTSDGRSWEQMTSWERGAWAENQAMKSDEPPTPAVAVAASNGHGGGFTAENFGADD